MNRQLIEGKVSGRRSQTEAVFSIQPEGKFLIIRAGINTPKIHASHGRRQDPEIYLDDGIEFHFGGTEVMQFSPAGGSAALPTGVDFDYSVKCLEKRKKGKQAWTVEAHFPWKRVGLKRPAGKVPFNVVVRDAGHDPYNPHSDGWITWNHLYWMKPRKCLLSFGTKKKELEDFLEETKSLIESRKKDGRIVKRATESYRKAWTELRKGNFDQSWLTAVLAYGFANNAHRPPEYIDLNEDGKPEVLRSYWHGRYITWIDDNGNLKEGKGIGDFVDDCMLVDGDGDELIDNNLPEKTFFFSLGNDKITSDGLDYMIDWVDTDKDGKWDVVRVHSTWRYYPRYPMAMEHFRIDKGGDNLNVVNWDTFMPQPRQDYGRRGCGFGYETVWGRFNDITIFLHNHPEMPHEIFYGYDMDNDHIPEIRLRTLDRGYLPEPPVGEVDHADLSVDIFGRTSPNNRCDWNFVLRLMSSFSDSEKKPMICGGWLFLKKGRDFDFLHKKLSTGSKPALNYRSYVMDFPEFSGNRAGDKFISDEISLPYRRSFRRVFLPHSKALKEILGHEWKACSFIWDENDDDHTPEGMFGHHYTIGDRFEIDSTYKGKGSFYIAPFDGKIHLYGAEGGIWKIEKSGCLISAPEMDKLLYSCPWAGYYWDAAQKQKFVKESKSLPLIRYIDCNDDGFIDFIEFDMDGDGQFERKVDLRIFKSRYSKILEKIEVFRLETDHYQSIQKRFLDSIERRYCLLVELCKRLKRIGLSPGIRGSSLEITDRPRQYSEMFWIQERCALTFRMAGRKDMLRLEQLLYLGDLEKIIEELG